MAKPSADRPQYTMPSVMPDHSRRRRQNSRIGPRAFIDSSMKGAMITATRVVGSPARSNSQAAPLLTPMATRVATTAPHAKQKAR